MIALIENRLGGHCHHRAMPPHQNQRRSCQAVFKYAMATPIKSIFEIPAWRSS